MSALRSRLRAAWRGLWRSRQLNDDMQEEMRLHIELDAERLMRERGLDAEEARRQAHVRFGGVEKYKEASRDVRSLQWLGAMTLDAKLAIRMLVKHRWLTLVGGFATAIAFAIAALFFSFSSDLLDPALPLPGGDRVVAVQYGYAGSENLPRDFLSWREELSSIEHLSAFRTVQHNLVASGAPPEPIQVAEMTASGFVVTRTPPVRGRHLLASDEIRGAAPVIVVGHHVWQTRFAGDPNIVGRTMNLGGVQHTIVGVMPDGFLFPFAHQFWIPLHVDPLSKQSPNGAKLFVFGRLGAGATIEKAQAELTTIVQRAYASRPVNERLRPKVMPYTFEHAELFEPMLVLLLRIAQFVVAALSLVVSVNMAILVYARTVTRLGEIAVRTAIGASRARILAQLFLESLVLTLIGAAGGLVLAAVAFRQIKAVQTGQRPFWIELEMTVPTVLYTFALALIAAVIMGVLPGLKATGSNLTANLHALNARAGTRLGATWTTLVVAQVAIAVAILPVAAYFAWPLVRMETTGPGFAAERFVAATVTVNADGSDVDPAVLGPKLRGLMSLIRSEPGVDAVTFSSAVPGFAGESLAHFDQSGIESQTIGLMSVALDLFETYEVPVVAGRAFRPGDVGETNAVIVNQTFVRDVFGNRRVLGQQFRYSTDAGAPRYHIVGIVRDFPTFAPEPGSDGEPMVYHAAAPGALHPFVLSVRFRGAVPDGVVDRLRHIAWRADPALQLRRAMPLTQFYDDIRSLWRTMAWMVGLVTLSVLLLSAAGIYALMSFTVAQRTREIGIRTALGAHPRQLLLGVFGRSVRQLGLGLLVGVVLATALFVGTGLSVERGLGLLLLVAVVMLVVGLLAAFVPARRSLRIDPIEALSAEV